MSEFDPDFEELESDFGEVMAILREGPIDKPTELPSEQVWTAIAKEVGGEVAAAATILDEEGEADDAAAKPAPVVSLDERRSNGRRFAVITAVAAAILLVAVPLALALGGDDGPEQRAELLALGGFDGSGRAELSGRTLEIDLEGLDAPEGSFYELWLLDLEGDELQDLRSLGRVEADGSFTVPADVDLSEFSVVDVSVEPEDNNPDHSGDSVLRGGLEQT